MEKSNIDLRTDFTRELQKLHKNQEGDVNQKKV